MITTWFLQFFTSFIGFLFSFLPIVTLPQLFLTYLGLAVRYWNSFLDTVPYLQLPWTLFLTVILPFEVVLITLRFFLGNRTPVNTN